MKTIGIIAEYNPFHTGHAYQIREARRRTGADYVIVVMSGEFVQRGEPAIYSKMDRASAALACGADVVLELPVRYATASAEQFARGAVELLNLLGCVDVLSFGTACTDLDFLRRISDILFEESEPYLTVLRSSLKKGKCYPAAREEAIAALLDTEQNSSLHELLSDPNAVLALEYLRSLKRCGSAIVPCPVPRIGSGYREEQILDSVSFTSAQAIRKSILSNREDWKNYVPAESIPSCENRFLCTDDLSLTLGYALMQAARSGELDKYEDISPDLANRIRSNLEFYKSFSDFCLLLKNKSTTYSHISRALLHILLQLRSCDYPGIHYARILGFRKEAEPLLHEIKQRASIPLISSPAKGEAILNGPGRQLLEEDIHAAQLYRLFYAQKYETLPGNEYREPIRVL